MNSQVLQQFVRLAGIAVICVAAVQGGASHAQVNPEIANCEEVKDESTLTQMELCGAHIGCGMVLKLQKVCAKAKGFLDRLKGALSGRDKVTNNDVFDAGAPELAPVESLQNQVSAARRAVREAASDPNHGSFSRKNSDKTSDTYYEGGLKDGNMHGAGVYINSAGGMGRGQMNAGQLQGHVQAVTRNGTIYAGEYANSSPAGQMAYQDQFGTVMAGTLRSDYKWSGVVEVTRRGGAHQKQLYDGEGKVVASGPFAGPGQTAEAPVLPQPSSAERVARGYDQRIASVRAQCTSSGASCDKGCAGAAVVGVLSVLAGKGAGADQATAVIEQCSARCDTAKSQCDEQVNALESEKAQAFAQAQAKDRADAAARQAARSPVVAPATGSTVATSPATTSGPAAAPAAAALTSSGSGAVDVTLVNRWEVRSEHKLLRVSFAAYDSTVARMKACENILTHPARPNCERNAYQYETAGLQNPYKLSQLSAGYVMPQCKYTPHSSSVPSIKQVPAEETCRSLLQMAIHEDVETSVKGIRTGTGLLGAWQSVPAITGSSTGDCSTDLSALDREARAIRARKPSLDLRASVMPDAQLGMYLAANKIRVLENSCKGRPEYAGVGSLRKSASELLQTCTMLGGGTPATCVPKLPW